jgi:hypothetical protein
MAKEWTERSPPAGVQQKLAHALVTFDRNSPEVRMAEKYAQQYVKEFSEQMWKQLGIRVFVLTAHKDTAGTIDVAEYVSYCSLALNSESHQSNIRSHDFNEDFGGRSFTSVRLNWMQKPIVGEWLRYAECELGNVTEPLMKTCCSKLSIDPDGDDSSTDEETSFHRKKKPAIQLEISDNGRPILPESVSNGELSFDQMHPIVRDYLNINYSEFWQHSTDDLPDPQQDLIQDIQRQPCHGVP